MRIGTVALAAGAILQIGCAIPSRAQDFPSGYQDGFKNRIVPQPQIAANPAKAGYYRVVFQGQDLGNASSCPDEDKVRRLEKALWQFVFQKKRDWGITVEVEFPSNASAIEGVTKLETGLILITKSGTHDCAVTISPNVNFKSSLIPIRSYYFDSSDPVRVKLLNWYGEKADDSRISVLWKGIGGIANFVVPGISLITDAAQKRGEDETRSIVNDKITSDLPYTLDVGDQGFKPIFVRLGPPVEGSEKPAGVIITLEYKGSVFANGAEFPDLSATDAATILQTSVGKPAKLISERVDKTIFANLNAQGDVKGFDAACEPMFVALGQIGLSDVDQAVFVWAMAMQNSGVGKYGIQQVKCLIKREPLLKTSVKIAIDHGAQPGLIRIATYKEMSDALYAVSRLAFGKSGEDDISYFAPQIQLSGDLASLGMPGIGNTVISREALMPLLAADVALMGCWAPDSGSKDALFLTPAEMIGVDPLKKPRLSGSAVSIKNGGAVAFIYRFDGVAANGQPQIGGLHVTAHPGADFVASFKRPSCSNYGWMAPLLTQ